MNCCLRVNIVAWIHHRGNSKHKEYGMSLRELFKNIHLDKDGKNIFGRYRWTDPDTSKESAKQVKASLEDVVFEGIRHFPNGAIADEIVDFLGMRWDSVTPRFAPLIRKGKVIDTGERRKGNSGRSQRVLKAVR